MEAKRPADTLVIGDTVHLLGWRVAIFCTQGPEVRSQKEIQNSCEQRVALSESADDFPRRLLGLKFFWVYGPVQMRVKRPGWHLQKGLFTSLALSWWPKTWILGGFPPFLKLVRVAHCASTIYADGVVDAEHLSSFWECRILVHVRQRMPTWPVFGKNPGHWVWTSLVEHLACVSRAHCWVAWVQPRWLPWEGLWKLVSGSFQIWPMHLYPFCWCCLVSICQNKS